MEKHDKKIFGNIIGIGKFNHTKILIDKDNNLSNDITLKNIVI